MNPRVIAFLIAAVGVGLGTGYLVTNGYVPWWLPVILLIGGLGATVWFIREQLRVAMAAQSARLKARKQARSR